MQPQHRTQLQLNKVNMSIASKIEDTFHLFLAHKKIAIPALLISGFIYYFPNFDGKCQETGKYLTSAEYIDKALVAALAQDRTLYSKLPELIAYASPNELVVANPLCCEVMHPRSFFYDYFGQDFNRLFGRHVMIVRTSYQQFNNQPNKLSGFRAAVTSCGAVVWYSGH